LVLGSALHCGELPVTSHICEVMTWEPAVAGLKNDHGVPSGESGATGVSP